MKADEAEPGARAGGADLEELALARVRLTILAEASRRFAEAGLDIQDTLRTITREVASRLRDSCTINLLSSDGQILEPVANAHVDPVQEAAVRETMANAPVRMDEGSLLARVVTSGEPVLVPSIPLEAWLASSVRPEYREHHRKYPITTILIVPLRIRETILGTMTVGRGLDGPAYTREDQLLLEDLAERAALAIQNAKLYEAEKRARTDAERAARTREELVAIVSHDLRNPLASISWQAAGILRVETASPRVRRYAEGIQRSAERMSRLISDLLDFASIQADQILLRPAAVEPAALIEECLEMFGPTAAERQIHLESRVPPSLGLVRCDQERALQVLANLLSNAVKVSRAGEAIRLQAEARAGEVVFSVADCGPGLEPGDLARVFDRYWRGDQTQYKGTGLGLAIAKGIVEAHGGRIWAESRPGLGATFSFSLPAAPGPGSGAP